MCPLRTKCICVDAWQQAVVQKGPRGCGCWAGWASAVVVMVVVYPWMIFVFGSEDRFSCDREYWSKFLANNMKV